MTEKGQIHELLQKRGYPLPHYELKEKGADHTKDFQCIVYLLGQSFTSDWKKSKKDAQNHAAKVALDYYLKKDEKGILTGIAKSTSAISENKSTFSFQQTNTDSSIVSNSVSSSVSGSSGSSISNRFGNVGIYVPNSLKLSNSTTSPPINNSYISNNRNHLYSKESYNDRYSQPPLTSTPLGQPLILSDQSFLQLKLQFDYFKNDVVKKLNDNEATLKNLIEEKKQLQLQLTELNENYLVSLRFQHPTSTTSNSPINIDFKPTTTITNNTTTLSDSSNNTTPNSKKSKIIQNFELDPSSIPPPTYLTPFKLVNEPLKDLQRNPQFKNSKIMNNFKKFRLLPVPSIVPDEITFFIYKVVLSRPYSTKEFQHNGKSYRFNGFHMYSNHIVQIKPVVHIHNQVTNFHFGVSLEEFQCGVVVKRSEYQAIITFHKVLFQDILMQRYLNGMDHNDNYFIPDIQCLSTPDQSIFHSLMELLVYEELDVNHLSKLFSESNSQYQSYITSKYKDKILVTNFGDFTLCANVNHNKESKPQTMDHKIVPLEKYYPSIQCIHSSAKNKESYWILKSLLYFDANGFNEKPEEWKKDMVNPPNPPKISSLSPNEEIKFQDYIKQSKIYDKDLCYVKIIGITSDIHSFAKASLLPLYAEVKWCEELYNFTSKNFINLKNHQLLREVFTHPSTKSKSNKVMPIDNINDRYRPFSGDNQRLELLGDSILKFVSSIYLFYRYPEGREGELSTLRSSHTNNSYLLGISKEIRLNEILRLTSPESTKKPQADVMEALFGAYFIEHGLIEVYKFIINIIYSKSPDSAPPVGSSLHSFPSFWCIHEIEKREEKPLPPSLLKFSQSLSLVMRCTCLLEDAFQVTENKHACQRLEFLGDSIIDMVVSEFLYSTFPKQQEGFMSEYRSMLVKNENFAKISKFLGIPPTCDKETRDLLSVKRLGDYFEAFVGCLFLDMGLEKTRTFIAHHLDLSKDYMMATYQLDENGFKDVEKDPQFEVIQNVESSDEEDEDDHNQEDDDIDHIKEVVEISDE